MLLIPLATNFCENIKPTVTNHALKMRVNYDIVGNTLTKKIEDYDNIY